MYSHMVAGAAAKVSHELRRPANADRRPGQVLRPRLRHRLLHLPPGEPDLDLRRHPAAHGQPDPRRHRRRGLGDGPADRILRADQGPQGHRPHPGARRARRRTGRSGSSRAARSRGRSSGKFAVSFWSGSTTRRSRARRARCCSGPGSACASPTRWSSKGRLRPALPRRAAPARPDAGDERPPGDHRGHLRRLRAVRQLPSCTPATARR